MQFHKYGHPTKVIQKTSSVLYYPDTPPSTNSSQSGKRLLSCSDSEDQDETPARRTKFDDLARPVELEHQSLDKGKAMMVSQHPLKCVNKTAYKVLFLYCFNFNFEVP